MQYQNILIIKMSALGDIVHALPCSVALRELYPLARITWLVHPQFGALLPGEPILDEVIYFNKAEFTKQSFITKIKLLWVLRKQLRDKKFDLIIDLQGLFKSAIVALLTGCSERIGYNDLREGSGLVSRAIHGVNDEGHVVQQYLDVIRYLGSQVVEPTFPQPDLAEEKERVAEMVEPFLNDKSWLDTVVLVPGAGWLTKEWPVDKFILLAKKLFENNKFVILAGGPAERDKGEILMKELAGQSIVNLIGRTSIRELAALMTKASICIGGDTGPIHIAAAMNTKVVALYGPSSGHRAGPYGKDVQIISSSMSCCPCFKRKCPINDNCMEKISVEEVYFKSINLVVK